MSDRSFLNKPYPAYRSAVQALEQVTGLESWGDAQRAAAEVVSGRIERSYAERRGLKRSSGHAGVCALLGKRCSLHGGTDDGGMCSPPGDDHGSLWNKDGKPYSYVFHPYSLHADTLRDLTGYCDARGLEIRLNASDSWHFPGVTLCVELTRKGEGR